MNHHSFTIAITVDQNPDEAFAAINDPRRWWKGAFEGSTDALGGEFTYRYKDMHFSKQEVTELVPGRKVGWTVTDSALQFVEHQDEWTGTKLVFDIARKGDKTEIRFTHVGLTPDSDCYGACSKGWTQLLNDLGALIASKGQPAASFQNAV
ncbi:MAG TPA: SRPBCC domain-containing protein [Polyangiaceae bacterium]|jgi:uncharacterized protein YndB with AHSA1/START domain|nr:SRPBCC domain-containing protein [Polyangiaceae bacterium]